MLHYTVLYYTTLHYTTLHPRKREETPGSRPTFPKGPDAGAGVAIGDARGVVDAQSACSKEDTTVINNSTTFTIGIFRCPLITSLVICPY